MIWRALSQQAQLCFNKLEFYNNSLLVVVTKDEDKVGWGFFEIFSLVALHHWLFVHGFWLYVVGSVGDDYRSSISYLSVVDVACMSFLLLLTFKVEVRLSTIFNWGFANMQCMWTCVLCSVSKEQCIHNVLAIMTRLFIDMNCELLVVEHVIGNILSMIKSLTTITPRSRKP